MEKKDFLNAVNSILPGVDFGITGSEGSELVTFEKSWLRSFNGAVSASYPLKSGVEGSVNAKYLVNIITKLKDDEIIIKELDDNKLMFRSGKSTLKLNVMERSSFADFITPPLKDKFQKLPDDFMDGLKLCVFSAGKDGTHGILGGICIEEGFMLSTDNYRVSRYKLGESDLNKKDSFVLPSSSVLEMLKLSDELSGFYFEYPWIHFRGSSGLVISFLLLKGEYPAEKIHNLVDKECEGEFEFPKELAAAVSRAEVLSWESMEMSNFLRLSRKGKYLIVEGKRDMGEYLERIFWKDSNFSEGIFIEVNPDFLRKILAVSRKFCLVSSGNRIVFSSNNYTHLLLVLIR